MKISYKDILEGGYNMNKLTCPSQAEMNKLQFVSMYFFDFELDDDDMYEKFGTRMVEVIECILNEKTFEYIKDNYENYLLMVNMPFLCDKLDCGVSIRGAWFNDFHEYDCSGIPIPEGQLTNFLTQLLEWIKE